LEVKLNCLLFMTNHQLYDGTKEKVFETLYGLGHAYSSDLAKVTRMSEQEQVEYLRKAIEKTKSNAQYAERLV